MATTAFVVSSFASLRALAQGALAQGQRPTNYSPYVDLDYSTRVYWGETHLHTSYSPDAGLVCDGLGPDEAFRFARGEAPKLEGAAGAAECRAQGWGTA